MSGSGSLDYSTLEGSHLAGAPKYFAETIANWLGEDEAEVTKRARLLVPAIMERLEIASIRLEANEDAQAIFETLNARVAPLAATDLVKNYVFRNFPGSADAVGDAYHKYREHFESPWWETEIQSRRVKDSRATWFIWQWILARTLEDIPIGRNFAKFKEYASNTANVTASILPQLKGAATRYQNIIGGAAISDGGLPARELFSFRVGTLDSESARPLLIWLDEPEQPSIPETEKQRVLRLLESWFVRRALVKAPSQGANRFIVELLRHLKKQPKGLLKVWLSPWLRSGLGCGRMVQVNSKYSDEFRRDAVALVASGMSQTQACKDLGISKSALTKWVQSSQLVSHGMVPSSNPVELKEMRAALKRIKELEMENEVLRPAAAYLSQANLPPK
jgi:transposase-like protein